MNQEAIERVIQHTVGVGAAGGVLTPMPIYGDFLTTHGFWLMSYAEWMKVVGTVYITVLLWDTLVMRLYNKVVKRKRGVKHVEKQEQPAKSDTN